MISDYLLLAGVALCLISVVVAVVQLVRMHPPRAAVILLILGIAALFLGAWVDPDPFAAQDVAQAWGNVLGGDANP